MYAIGRALNKRITHGSAKYLQRWPETPRVLIFGPPNVPVNKLSQRLAIDLGVPIISMKDEFEKVKRHAGRSGDYDHPFYEKVKEILETGDKKTIAEEKIGLKLLRIAEYAQEGFILNDFPNTVSDAESLEELSGGMNAFMHLNMPELFLAQIESAKYTCDDWGATYWREDIYDEETGLYQAANYPEDGFCHDCGSIHIKPDTDPEAFEYSLAKYNKKKDQLLDFYNYLGLLVDVDLRKGGIDDYERVKQKLQYNIKF